MDFRKLRHRVTIEQRSVSQDSSGDMVTTWSTFAANVPAEVAPLSVREFIGSQSLQSAITARIMIRYRAGLTADMRILHNGKIYNPQGWLPDPDSGLDYVTAPCTEGTNQG